MCNYSYRLTDGGNCQMASICALRKIKGLDKED